MKKKIKMLNSNYCENDLYQDRGKGAIIETDDISILGDIKEISQQEYIGSTSFAGPMYKETKVYYRWFYLKGNENKFLMYSWHKTLLFIEGWDEEEELQ